MLNYFKLILMKVSFEPSIFERELTKAIASGLHVQELKEFKKWCYKNFSTTHLFILDKAFFKLPQLLG